jgi:hypothetical protein
MKNLYRNNKSVDPKKKKQVAYKDIPRGERKFDFISDYGPGFEPDLSPGYFDIYNSNPEKMPEGYRLIGFNSEAEPIIESIEKEKVKEPNYDTDLSAYLKKKGQPKSYSDRKKLASQYGIDGYKGSASQNIKLLGLVKEGKPTLKKEVLKKKPVEVKKKRSPLYKSPTTTTKVESEKVISDYKYDEDGNKVPVYSNIKRRKVNK